MGTVHRRILTGLLVATATFTLGVSTLWAAHSQGLNCDPVPNTGATDYSVILGCRDAVARPSDDTNGNPEAPFVINYGMHFPIEFPGIAALSAPGMGCGQDVINGHKRLLCSGQLNLGEVRPINFSLHVTGRCGESKQINSTVNNPAPHQPVNSDNIYHTITFPPCPAPAPQCSDGRDNDGDTRIDLNDPGCSNGQDNDERDESCHPTNVSLTANFLEHYNLRNGNSVTAVRLSNGSIYQSGQSFAIQQNGQPVSGNSTNANVPEVFIEPQQDAFRVTFYCQQQSADFELNYVELTLNGAKFVGAQNDRQKPFEYYGNNNHGRLRNQPPYGHDDEALVGVGTNRAILYSGCSTHIDTVTLFYTRDADVCQVIPACRDGRDNDGDALTDYPSDPGCSSADDDNEYNYVPQCRDGIDNDSDGRTDGNDLGCTGSDDDNESDEPQCRDGRDNDNDGRTDFPNDPGCTSDNDTDERDQTQCSDGRDNDNDGRTDFPQDRGCSGPDDPTEDGELQCSDGRDNDSDGYTDFPNDPGCSSGSDTDERDQFLCEDRRFHDGKVLISFDEPGLSNGMAIGAGVPQLNSKGVSITSTTHANVREPYSFNARPGPISGGNQMGFNLSPYSPSAVTTIRFVNPNNPSQPMSVDGSSIRLWVSDTELRIILRTFDAQGSQIEQRTLSTSYQNVSFSQGNVARIDLISNGDLGSGLDDIQFALPSGITLPPNAGCPANQQPQCSDGRDNDGDGRIDFPSDPGCSSTDDGSEQDEVADLSITKTGPSSMGFTDTVIYTLSVRNAGPASAPNVVVTDEVPQGMIFEGNQSSGGCAVNQNGTIVNCTGFSLDRNQTRNFSVAFRILRTGNDVCQERTFRNTASVSANNDSNTSNNRSETVSTTVICTTQPQCSDGRDNDNDGRTDYPNDPGCTSGSDNDETDSGGGSCPSSVSRFATAVIQHSGVGSDDDSGASSASNALREPDGRAVNFDGAPGFAIFGFASQITRFDSVRVHLVDFSTISSGNGPEDETFTVLMSQDGTNYVSAGSRSPTSDRRGQRDAFDFAVPSTLNGTVRFVKILNARILANNPYEGPDIDALELLNASCTQIAQCRDGIDNDNDGRTDFPSDPGCSSLDDNDETNSSVPQCRDGIDNDNDGRTDFPSDPGCSSLDDNDETNSTLPQCRDGIDNDNDGRIDFPLDLGCTSLDDNDETNGNLPQCRDGIDNDNDGRTDFPQDPGCSNGDDTNEGDEPQCSDGRDNDNDGRIDFPQDPGCTSGNDNDETDTENRADLVISKTGPDTVQRGQTAIYSVTVRNNGPARATNVVIADIIPSGLTFNANSSNSRCALNSSQTSVLCNNIELANNETITVLIAFNVPTISNCSTTTVSNTATVSTSTTDPTTSNNTSNTVSTSITCGTSTPQCRDGIDNDNDGRTDFPSDPGCSNADDNDETNGNLPQCRDGIDNDNDGRSDLNDPGCDNGDDTNEGDEPQCRDLRDNDSDGQIDFPNDPGCDSRNDNDERNQNDDDDDDDDDDRIRIDIQDRPDPAQACDEIDYKIELRNDGDNDRTIDVSAEFDHRVEFVDASDGGDDTDDNRIEWDDITIGEDDTEILDLTIRACDDINDHDRLELEVRGGGARAVETTRIEDDRDDDDNGGGGGRTTTVSVDKRASTREAGPNDIVTYTITVRNLSSRPARNVVVEDTFTAGSVDILQTGGGNTLGNGLEWNFDTLAANGTQVMTYQVRVGSDMRHGQIISNNVLVRSPDFDRTATDTEDVRIITQLPQTGIGFFNSWRAKVNHLRPVSTKTLRKAEATSDASVPLTVWITITTMGLGIGGFVGKKFIP